jgi:hypothetical protein
MQNGLRRRRVYRSRNDTSGAGRRGVAQAPPCRTGHRSSDRRSWHRCSWHRRSWHRLVRSRRCVSAVACHRCLLNHGTAGGSRSRQRGARRSRRLGVGDFDGCARRRTPRHPRCRRGGRRRNGRRGDRGGRPHRHGDRRGDRHEQRRGGSRRNRARGRRRVRREQNGWRGYGRRRSRFDRRRRRAALGRRLCLRPGGQHGQWIEVALILRGDPQAQMDVRLRELRVAARSDRADRVPLADRCALLRDDRAEVRERHRVTVGRRDGEGFARRWDRAGERDRPRGGRQHGVTRLGTDVDPTVLPGRVRAPGVEHERLQNGAVDRPRPRAGDGRESEHGDGGQEHEQETPDRRGHRHETPPC